MEQSGARLEFVYVSERAELTIRALVAGQQGNTLVIEGTEGPFITGTTAERGQLQIIGPAAVAFWKALTVQPLVPSRPDDLTRGN
ncbi:MAG TPA: hypothetical protein VFS21_29720 [Roseiflexaceae bacterium]|nr:hypothetical protein [Roseiflexaceae bacterium]